MSELVWGIKNGDMDQVKEIVEKKVGEDSSINRRLSDALKVDHGRSLV